jgi:Flp pilus assembly protein TadD
VHALVKVGRYGDAKARGKSAAALHSDNAEILSALAMVHMVLGEYPEAIRQLEQAVRIAPTAPEYRQALEMCRQRIR